MSVSMKSLRLRMFFCCAAGLICYGASTRVSSAQGGSRIPGSNKQTQPYPDQRNESRAAAPAEQIRVVLVKDPGLLVELERIIEREAIAKGQLVEDSDLTQQAIFDRLEDDLAFRATATRLVQRFGYLLPSVNPDSEIGKEQELLLKERARRLVQVEAEEDQESLNSRKNEERVSTSAGMASCDGGSQTNCGEPVQRPSPGQIAIPREIPGDNTPLPPNVSPMPRPNEAGVIQTRLSGESTLDSSDRIRAAMRGVLADSSGMQPPGDDLERYAAYQGYGAANLTDAPSRQNPTPSSTASRNTTSSSPLLKNGSNVSAQGAIVRRPNPYSDVPSLVDLYVQVSAHEKAPERFGVGILGSGTRDPNAIPMDLPAGPDYVVGPGDGLAIDLWGAVSQRLQRTVDSEGRILLPEYGPILVSGKTLGDVQLTIQQLMRTQLRDVSTDVSLSRLRTVRIYVVGEVAEPGAYDLSSLSSPLNAIVAAGGLTERGSLRLIKHYRGKQLIAVVDAYDLLLRGVGADQKKLENGDSLLIPPVGPQVTVEGMVRRPAIYELRENTSLAEVLELAGGVLPAAALKQVQVERLMAHENRTMFSLDLSAEGNPEKEETRLRSFQVQDGDRIHIFPIAPYNAQAVYLEGHVLRPGRYSYRQGMTLKDLVTSYSDLLPEPEGNYAEIIRLNPPDFRPTVESFNLAAAISNLGNAPQLKPLDTVRIFSKYDFAPGPEISVDGEVRAPGKYATPGQAHFRDAIYTAGGVTADAAMDSAQIFRNNADGTMMVLSVNLAEAISGAPTENLLLHSGDRIIVHRNTAKIEPATVYVKGDVANPGRYPLAAGMSVQELVRVAGGLKPSADSKSAILAHHDTSQPGAPEIETLNINLTEAMAGHSGQDELLANGDVLTVRKSADWRELGATVTIRGEVQNPGTYGIRPGESLSSVLAEAGGFTAEAYPYGTVLTRKEVRDLEMQSHQELIARVRAEETQLKALPESDTDQKNLKLTALAQNETALTQLEAHLPVGRVVLHGTRDDKSFDQNAGGTPLRSGDLILVPKKPDYVMIRGQVYNTTAVGYIPGRSGNWYLSQAGGFTELADKKGVFVIRANGSVLAAKNNRGYLTGDPMEAVLMPGDVIVVPEKAPKIGNRNWMPLMQAAQVATSVALAVAYLKP